MTFAHVEVVRNIKTAVAKLGGSNAKRIRL